MQKTNYIKLFKDILIFGVGVALAKMVQFLLMPLYTSYLSTSDYGTAELINNLSELFLPIVTLCIYESVFRFTVESPKNKSKFISASLNSLFLIAMIGLLFFLIAYYVFDYHLLFYMYFLFFAYALRTILAFYIRGKGCTVVFSLSGCIMALALGIGSYIFLVIFKLKVEGYLLAIFLSYIVSSIYIVIAGKVYEDYQPIIKCKNELREMLSYSMPLIVYNIFYWGTTISGRYILLFFYDTSVTGLYVATLKIAAVINFIQQTVYSAFQLNASQQFESDNREEYYSKIINLFFKIYLGLGSFIICFTPILAKFTLKKEFYEGKVYLPLILFASIINCVSSLIGTMYSAYKVTNRTIKISLIGASVNIGISLILVPYIQIWGVCIASVICYLSQVLYKIYDIQKFCKLKFQLKEILLLFFVLLLQVCLAIKGSMILSFINVLISIGAFIIICFCYKKQILEMVGNIKNYL